jgi:flagella basal body P-ring formation protein FlgA
MMRCAAWLIPFLAAAPVDADTLVAATTIRGGVAIGPEDVVLIPDTVPGALSDPAEAVGLETRVNLYPGRPIRAGDLRAPAVIGRNDIVTLRYDTGAILIVTEGRSLDRAARGERLRVLNLASRTTVAAVAAGPGLAIVDAAP